MFPIQQLSEVLALCSRLSLKNLEGPASLPGRTVRFIYANPAGTEAGGSQFCQLPFSFGTLLLRTSVTA